MQFLQMITGQSWLWPLGYALALLLALSILIFVHELGHFSVARLLGVKVDAFSLGFGREIWGFNDRHGSRWKLCWIPLGGYVRFAGDTNAASLSDGSVEEGLRDPQHFANKPIWQRACVVAAGPMANFLLAIVIFATTVFFVGEPYLKPSVGSVALNSGAAAAGIQPGDMIVSIAGTPINSFDEIVMIVRPLRGDTVPVIVNRNGKTLELSATIGARTVKEGWSKDLSYGVLGIGSNPDEKPSWLPRSPMQAVGHGFERTAQIIQISLSTIGRLFTGQEDTKQLGGMLTMANQAGETASMGLLSFILFIAVMSVSIGFINLFPIPMLDGGHLVFYAIEAVRRKPLGLTAQGWSFRIGVVLILGLMLLGNGNDVVRGLSHMVTLNQAP